MNDQVGVEPVDLQPVGLEEIRAAAERIAEPHVVRTPLLPATWGDAPRPLYLKPESLQRIGAFKIRGAMNAVGVLAGAAGRLDRGIVAASSGNHGQAVAYAASVHGARATVVIPEGSPPGKIAAVEALGAEIVMVEPAARDRVMHELAAAHGYAVVPPYDHRDVIAGQGTVGLELVADLPEVATVLVPVGGGGLISGVAAAVKALRPEARVIGVEPELAADLAEGMRLGQRVTWPIEHVFRTIADGTRTPSVGELPWVHISALVDEVLTVTEEQILSAVGTLARSSRLVAEPSGALTTAAYLAHGGSLPPGPVVAIVSGGNIAPELLAAAVADEAG